MMERVVAAAILLGSAVSAQRRIIGGAECRPHSQPWQVFLYDTFNNICGGVLINKSWVVTAGHCHPWQASGPVEKIGEEKQGSIIAFLGLHSLWKKRKAQTIQVVEAIRHPDSLLNNDIMLLRLSPPATLGSRVKTLPMSEECVPVGTKCVVSGWGGTVHEEEYIQTGKLQCVEVKVLPRKLCQNAYGGNFVQSEICAGAMEGGRDSCQGDSGGPLVCNGVLHGLVAWGGRCGAKGRPGVYTEICKFRSWIIENISG